MMDWRYSLRFWEKDTTPLVINLVNGTSIYGYIDKLFYDGLSVMVYEEAPKELKLIHISEIVNIDDLFKS